MFLRALEIRERLAYNNPVQFEPGLAATLLNLSVFYADRKPGEAEKTYSRAVELYDRLVQNNPAQFEPLLARTLFKLGGITTSTIKIMAKQKK